MTGDLEELLRPVREADRIVVGQLGQSLDGRIATLGGHSHYITGPGDIVRLHLLRSIVDAVVVGAGTVLADDPRLTVREVEGPDPVRVVLDPSGRLDPGRRVFTEAGGPTLWFQTPGAGGTGAPGVEVVRLPPGPGGGFPPEEVLRELRARGWGRILVEGGGITVSRFLEAGLLDRLHVCVAPLILGSGRPALTLPPIDSLAEALRPRVRHFRLGDDVLFDLEPGVRAPG